MERKVRRLENILDSGLPSMLFGHPVVIRNDDLSTEMERLKASDLLVLSEDIAAIGNKSTGAIKAKASPFKIYRPEAN